MQAGDTFLLRDPDVDPHLWVVISEPQRDADRVLIVNFTSYKDYHDQSCTLTRGDHPFIRHKTCVNYGETRVATNEELESLAATGHLVRNTPVSPQLLRRLRAGAATSERILEGHRKILIEQGLIEE